MLRLDSLQQIASHPIARPIAVAASIGIALAILHALGIALVSATGLGTIAFAAVVATCITRPKDPLIERLEQAATSFLKTIQLTPPLKISDIVSTTNISRDKFIYICLQQGDEKLNLGVGLKITNGKVTPSRFAWDKCPDATKEEWDQRLPIAKWNSAIEGKFSTEEFNQLFEQLESRSSK